jgi:ABC-type transport system involved in multi-copper enzyme maturation permease subunit
MATTMPISFAEVFILTCAMGMSYLAHMLYCAELDLMNPQVELYATVGNSESNPNETKATLTAFLISFIVAAAVFLLLLEGGGTSVYVKFLCIAAAVMVYRILLFFQKLRLYYKEK